MYKIKEFAGLLGISVRMLHHYDKIGLLSPEETTAAGYRLYGRKNIEMMEQILLFKELDFSLQEIKRIVSHKGYDKSRALSAQKELLQLKRERLDRIIGLIDTMITTKERIVSQKIQKAFNEDAINEHKEAYAKEAQERWGETDPYKESQRRFASYSKEQLNAITEAQTQIYRDLALLLEREVSDPLVQQKVHEAREHISRYWYECTLEIFGGLGMMYVADERFTRNIDKSGEGVARFLSEAIAYYVADRG